jgi:predicted RNA binding protein YcfA (HicA-like mRNA interferase family)
LGRLKPLPFREIKRRLEAAGFAEAGQKGSHVKFARRSGEIVDTAIVPKKREIPVGTLRSILSQAHISPDEWGDLG